MSAEEQATVEAAARYLSTQCTQSPSGACARLLLQISAAAAADGASLQALAAAVAAQLARVAPLLASGTKGAQAAAVEFDCVRCWCTADAAKWGRALQAALAGAPAAAVQSVPVSSLWVCNGGAGGGSGEECCVVVEVLLCG